MLRVPPWLKWFTMGIEYHHVHHLSVEVPGYRLQRCHEEAPPGLFPSDAVSELGLREFVRSLQLQAYDESVGRFVTFAELEGAAKQD